MSPLIISPALRFDLMMQLKARTDALEGEKAPCHDAYPSVRILQTLDITSLIERSRGSFPADNNQRVALMLTQDAAALFERRAWNEYNGYLLLMKAIERAWRLPLTEGDVRRAVKRLREQCPDQALLRAVEEGEFKQLSTTDMQRGKELGLIIDGLWCPWMDSWEVANPLYLAL